MGNGSHELYSRNFSRYNTPIINISGIIRAQILKSQTSRIRELIRTRVTVLATEVRGREYMVDTPAFSLPSMLSVYPSPCRHRDADT